MLYGIDISSWQDNINLAALKGVDFVIVKATEGITYVNPFYVSKSNQTLELNKLLGVYHYARANDPIDECKHFIKNYNQYKHKAIPVLDWEENQSVDWVNKFVRYFHEQTGVWCWIYANPWRFNQGGVDEHCDRWIAAYPTEKEVTLTTDPGNVPATQGSVCCWQYSSNGKVDGFTGRLDVNHYYGDKASWGRYANPNGSSNSGNNEAETNTTSTLENDEYKVTVERKK